MVAALNERHAKEMETGRGNPAIDRESARSAARYATELRANVCKILDAEQAAARAKAAADDEWSVRYEQLSHAKDEECES